ncbi:MAG: beta-ketoacyl synthase N-terminal-like domain-containing protein [Desulfobacteraceae bacterium]|jgi:malonyl-ACP decarboxylase
MGMQEVVVTGMGILCSFAHNIEEYAEGLVSRKSNFKRVSFQENGGNRKMVCAVIENHPTDDVLKKIFNDMSEVKSRNIEQIIRHASIPLKRTIVAAAEAWEAAALFEQKIAAERTGLVVAGHNLTQNYQYRNLKTFSESMEFLTPRYSLQFMDTHYIGTLSEIFEIKGESFTVGGASASGNVALHKAGQLVKAGEMDACLVIGPMADFSPLEFQGFINIGAMGGHRYVHDPDKACRPFDSGHDGFIYGQGCGCMVIESGESAARRGVDLLARLESSEIALDANWLASPDVEGEVRAMVNTIRKAGISASDIDYLNTHGSSSPLGDKTEIHAVKRVFGSSLDKLWLNSTKGLTGHCIYSAGVVEAIATVIQIRKGVVHPNNNLEVPIDEECRLVGAEACPAEIEHAMSNSFGFGGINTSLILRG